MSYREPVSLDPGDDGEFQPGPSTRSPRTSSSSAGSLDLPSLQPLSHSHPLLSATSFDADAFLLSRLHIPLEELRGELREYLGVLREELVQLINDDYEEFISLGTGLKGEKERLVKLNRPLVELSLELQAVRDLLVTQQAAVQTKLDERAALREEKALLDLLGRLFDTISRAETLLSSHEEEDTAKLVARVASEYTQVVYLVNKAAAEGCEVVNTLTERIGKIKKNLSADLSTLLSTAIHDGGRERLRQCLKTYELIEGWAEAEEVVRGEFRAFCRNNITSTALLIPSSPTVPETPLGEAPRMSRLDGDHPLASLLNRVLGQLELHQPLLLEAEAISERFDFFARVYWPEISAAIVENLGSVIFAAGRPDELHKNYAVVHRFIALIEEQAPSVRVIESMRESPEFEAFERRWQLPVYFQLRWKEIVGTLENVLSASGGTSAEWGTPQAEAAWRAVERCWAEDVYLPELAPRFWRLSLQIATRYVRWAQRVIDETSGEDEAADEPTLRLATAIVSDLDQLGTKCKSLDVCASLGLQDVFTPPTASFEAKIVSILSRRCIEPLKLVRSVASQFRATPNKTAESQPSYFIPTVFRPIHHVLDSRSAIRERYGEAWSTPVADQVFSNYAGILASVRKTEDLLRRHRKTKKSTFSLFSTSAASPDPDNEEERFKRQMLADIDALASDAKSLGVAVDELAGWKELREVVTRPTE